ncbi:MAG: polysaccharide biosynthesis tyrosine autokinase [Planctomycetes bacterium]|nr:polysaccharide biosynthesis tyrosine autokinase [Planctomycetota bacterium]
MEFKDYVAVLRRRWLAAVGVAAGLELAFVAYLYYGERPRHAASCKIIVRDEKRQFSPQDLQGLQYEARGYNYYTKEALLSARPVYDVAAAVYLAVRGRSFESVQQRKRWWRETAGEAELAAWMQERGLARSVTVADGRIVALEVDEEKVGGTASMLQSVSMEKPDQRIQIQKIAAVSSDPDDAMLQVNAVAKGAVVYSRTESLKEMAAIERDLQARVDAVNSELQTLMTRLGPVAEQIRQSERRIQNLTDRQSEIEREIEKYESRVEQIRSRRDELRGITFGGRREPDGLPAIPDAAGLSSPILDRFRSDLVGLRTEIAVLTISREPGSRDIVKLRERMIRIHEECVAELDRVRQEAIERLDAEERSIQLSIIDLKDKRAVKVGEIDAVKADLRERDPDRRKLDALTQELSRYRDLQVRVEQSRTLQQGYYTIEEVATSADPSPSRWPRSAAMLALIAFALGIAAAFVLDYVDSNLRTDYDVRRYLNLPCVAIVEDVGRASPIILRASPRDPLSENFSMIATLVRSYLGEREFKTVSVCSAVPRQGKTTVASNLAVALARKGLQVALVDADLRLPQIHTIFGVDNSAGLANWLRGEIPPETDLDSVLKPCEVPGLRILTSGTAADAPAQVLESEAMADLVRRIRERYEVVVFDTPPITSVGDALSLARVVETNLFVVGAGMCERRAATWSKQLLENVRADVCGVILNFAPKRQVASYYYYYYYSPSKSVRTRT